MRERYQGGSLAGFIIIGAVLALVLVGGLYGLNRYNAEQSKEATSEQENGSGEQPNDERSPDSSSESQESSNQTAPESGTEEGQDEATNESGFAAAGGESSHGELPATGPADAVAAIVAIVALGFAATHYLQSRSYKRH